MWNEAEARQAYNAYGVDLIRTAGVLLRTTPSAIYRASILFQRLQRNINDHFRSRYLSSEVTKRLIEETKGSSPREEGDPIDCAVSGKVEYLIPDHVGQDMVSGLTPLADLLAPLDYCVSHIIDHEDVGFLAAACLLVAVKMEDPGIRIRHVVNVFMRLSQRRCGIPAMIYLKPPPERYEDFKACVVESEEILLQQTGFQTFVECPHKYVVVFLHLLVEDRASAKGAASPAFTKWLSRAISWVNDAPRCAALAQLPATALAAFAVQWGCPAGVVLPERWHVALGVTADALACVQAAFEAYLAKATISSKEELDAIRAAMPRVEYRTKREKMLAQQRRAELDLVVRQGNEDPKEGEAGAGKLAASGDHDEAILKVDKMMACPPTPAALGGASILSAAQHLSAADVSNTAELLDAIGLSLPEPPASSHGPGSSLRLSPKPPENEDSLSSSFSASSDGDDFEYEDLRQVQKRRRKEAAEELHRRNVERSEEKNRRKHRSPDRHQERSQNRRSHHQSHHADRYGDDRKRRDRERRDRGRDSSWGGSKPAKGGRRYDLKPDHAKREDDRRRRH